MKSPFYFNLALFVITNWTSTDEELFASRHMDVSLTKPEGRHLIVRGGATFARSAMKGSSAGTMGMALTPAMRRRSTQGKLV